MLMFACIVLFIEGMTLWYPPLNNSFELTWHMLMHAYD